MTGEVRVLEPAAVRLPPLGLDRSSPVPLYHQVATRLEQLIESGALPVGSRLENELDLADQLAVSRPTVRRAIAGLVDRGLLVRRRGVGTRVVEPKVRRPVALTSLYDDLRQSGRAPRTEVLSLQVRPVTDAVAAVLDLPEGTPAAHLDRLRWAGDEPLALMHNVLPAGLLDLRAEDLEAHGLYELMREVGAEPRMATEVIGARAATAAESRTLHEPRGAPLLTKTRTAWDAAGRAVEHGSHVYRASRYAMEVHLTVG